MYLHTGTYVVIICGAFDLPYILYMYNTTCSFDGPKMR